MWHGRLMANIEHEVIRAVRANLDCIDTSTVAFLTGRSARKVAEVAEALAVLYLADDESTITYTGD